MHDTEMIRLYRENRRPYTGTEEKGYGDHPGRPFIFQSPARYAVRSARQEMALRAAERDRDDFRFVWEWDQAYEPDGDYDTEREARELDSESGIIS